MANSVSEMSEIHWMMDVLQSIDVGLVVIDKDFTIQVWNGFMENHSGIKPHNVLNKNILELFPDIPSSWFKRKIQSVMLLKGRSFTTWEQRPYLFEFKNYRPITGAVEFMYQNITFIPLLSADGNINHIGMNIYDVTDIATGQLQLLKLNNKLEVLSRTDRLTQLNNRGYWEECLAREFDRDKRTREICSLLIFDIDHFKKVNDVHGHTAGDEIIRVTAKTLLDSTRATDICGRYGGEEFVVILINTNAQNAKILAERIRERIAALQISFEGTVIPYTISLGIAEFHSDIKNHTQWIEQADKALYEAKESGRNNSKIYNHDT
ncbi:diguanylate cyclase (GGDEF domain) with PAS/PAC sensor [hydrothermal vent metagenome]|uniref:Diguanylate cyclase (GGDEF domain) with PAS/PAC sensor n=1 Tax=hydrothermal vent metagenome TaxID=652676 RepID=A0A3B1A8Q8_9ZZZZ